jgi:hypothetical protein
MCRAERLKDMSVYFETRYIQEVKKRKGPKAGQLVKEPKSYRTKSFTDLHIHVADKYGARVCRMDTSVDFPLGVWTEVVYDGKEGEFSPSFNTDGSPKVKRKA